MATDQSDAVKYGLRGLEFLRVYNSQGKYYFDCLVCFGHFDWDHCFAHQCITVLKQYLVVPSEDAPLQSIRRFSKYCGVFSPAVEATQEGWTKLYPALWPQDIDIHKVWIVKYTDNGKKSQSVCVF